MDGAAPRPRVVALAVVPGLPHDRLESEEREEDELQGADVAADSTTRRMIEAVPWR